MQRLISECYEANLFYKEAFYNIKLASFSKCPNGCHDVMFICNLFDKNIFFTRNENKERGTQNIIYLINFSEEFMIIYILSLKKKFAIKN